MRTAFGLPAAALFALGCTCGRSPTDEATAAATVAPARGDRVVVEESAATFFEAAVLSADGSTLSVQTVDGGDPRSVARHDVYDRSVPHPAPQPGSFAICGDEGARWVACRVVTVGGERITAETSDGGRLATRAADVLEPTPLTEMNLRARFERSAARRDFATAAKLAGDPIVPRGWKPSPNDQVIGRMEDGWFSGRVVEIDDAIRVEWRDRPRQSWVDRRALIPEPPWTPRPLVLEPGRFALVRPSVPASPWEPVVVDRVEGTAIHVRDAAANRRAVTLSDLAPLGESRRASPSVTAPAR